MVSIVSKSDATTAMENVPAAMHALENASAGPEELSSRRKLRLEAMKLSMSLGDRNEDVWPRIFQVNVSVAIGIPTNLGLWDAFAVGTTVTRAEIVERSNADEIMMIRIMQQLTTAGVLVDVPEPGYRMTSAGEPYLDPTHRAFNIFVLQEVIPTVCAMPKTLAERGYESPTRESGTPFKWANGEELWTFLRSHPQRAQNMVMGIKSLNTGSLAGEACPFGEELAKLNIEADDVAIVDIAVGQGHIMHEVRRLNPHLKGRFIVQDFPSTFEAVSSPPPGIEFMPYDMFTPQPVKNAHVYYYRHILHNWNDADAIRFLQQLVPTLKAQPHRANFSLWTWCFQIQMWGCRRQ